MDFNKKKKIDINKAPTVVLGMLGGLAACTAEIMTFPLDNIKTRMQMNGKEGLPFYKNTLDCVIKTFKNNYIKGFYKGISAALARQMVYSSTRMLCYEKINRTFSADVENVGFFRKFLSGGVAGAIGCVVGTPFDVFKIRLINDIMGKKYSGLRDVYSKTLQTDGISGLFKGTNVNVLRAIIVNAAELAFYDKTKMLLVNNLNLDKEKKSTHFIASLSAGFFGALMSSPADVIKTRYMNQLKTSEDTEMYKGIIDCFAKISKTEGLKSFYKGFLPLYLRLAPWNVGFFMSYEYYKKKFLPLIMKE